MGNTKLVLTCVFASVAASAAVTVVLNAALHAGLAIHKPIGSGEQNQPMYVNTEMTTASSVQQSEIERLAERSNQLATQMEQLDFSDPRHEALLQELEQVNTRIGEIKSSERP